MEVEHKGFKLMLVSVKSTRDNKREPRRQGYKGGVVIRRDEGHGVGYGCIRTQTASQSMIPSTRLVVKLKQEEGMGREAGRGGGQREAVKDQGRWEDGMDNSEEKDDSKD